MAGGSALVGIMIAARAQRLQAVTDAFRIAGATAPERARTLAALGLGRCEEVAELARVGVLVAGPERDSWYLSEAAVVARRAAGARKGSRALMLSVLLLLAVVGAVALGVLMANRR
jgi:hypothetical protein